MIAHLLYDASLTDIENFTEATQEKLRGQNQQSHHIKSGSGNT